MRQIPVIDFGASSANNSIRLSGEELSYIHVVFTVNGIVVNAFADAASGMITGISAYE
ncbi:MAG: hypothetical protein IT353_01155 [Gemmatimonadaceae bacterium]|nr:hypothetical protein [Gemmatimonadaceae bacterium]